MDKEKEKEKAFDPTYKLAMVYQKIAELELSSDKKQPDVWKTIKQTHTSKTLEPEVVKNIEHVFREACNPVASSNDERLKSGPEDDVPAKATTAPLSFQTNGLTADTVRNIRVLFMAEQQFADTLHSSIAEKLLKIKASQQFQEKVDPEIFRLQDDLVKQNKKLNEYEELCRNLQKLNKEKDDHRRMLLEHEKAKTKQIEQECIQSIETVTKKIEEEEADLLTTSNENQDLRMKLDQFMIHLKMRKEKLKNEEKTKELYFRLKEAKKSQLLYFLEQEKLKLASHYSNINHSKETIHHLQQQLLSFQSKFQEFDQTLVKSAMVIEKVQEREVFLEELLVKVSKEHEALKEKVKESDVLIIQTIEKKRQAEEQVNTYKQQLAKLEKKCRKLLTKRQQVMKEYETTTPTTTTPESVLPVSESAPTPVPETTLVSEPMSESLRTDSPTSGPLSSGSVSTPSRKIHNFVLSSSSASSPSRILHEAGEGSPINSPKSTISKKK